MIVPSDTWADPGSVGGSDVVPADMMLFTANWTVSAPMSAERESLRMVNAVLS